MVSKLFGGEDEERIRKIELRHRLEIIEIEKAQFMHQKEEADKKKQEYEILLGQKRKKELEIHEIELAMKAIEEAASQVQRLGQELNEKISEIFVI